MKKQDDFHSSFTKEILDTLSTTLNRKLTHSEITVFSMARSGIAYEMILDYIIDVQKSKNDIESYVDSVVLEYYG